VRLNIGQGRARNTLDVVAPLLGGDGWKHIDICAAYEPDECYDVSTGIREPDGSVACIWMGDVLEHIPRAKTASVLTDCHRVLSPGGALLVCVPDMSEVMRRWVATDGLPTEGMPLSWLIWGEQDESGGGANEVPDTHRNGFTAASLSTALGTAGFGAVERVVIHGGQCWYELSMLAKKGNT
jgi:hypothetical protein